MDVNAERVLTLYRWRSKPEVTSHESLVIQPWTAGPDSEPLDLFVRIHLVLESTEPLDEAKPKVLSEVVPYREEMKYMHECFVRSLTLFGDLMMFKLHHGHKSYDIWSGKTCVDFAEMTFQVLSLSKGVGQARGVPPEHQRRQRNVTPLWERALVALADVHKIITLVEVFHHLVFFLALLGDPFVGLGGVYMGLVLVREAFVRVRHLQLPFKIFREICRILWICNWSLSLQDLLRVVRVAGPSLFTFAVFDLGLTCLLLFKVWLLWLWLQGSISILVPLALQISVEAQEYAFGLVSEGPGNQVSVELDVVSSSCGTLLETAVWVGTRDFFKFILSLTLLLPGPWLLIGSLTVMSLVGLASSRKVMGCSISVVFFVSVVWKPKIIYSVHFIVVACNLVLNPRAGVWIEPWMATLLFCCVFPFGAYQCLQLYVKSVVSRNILLEKSKSLETVCFAKHFSGCAVRQTLTSALQQGRLDSVPKEYWFFILHLTGG